MPVDKPIYPLEHLVGDIGSQQVFDGQTHTLAKFVLAAWMPTDDGDEAQRMLAEKVRAWTGPLVGEFDGYLAPSGEET